MIDVIILSDAKTPFHRALTENALYTLTNSEEIEMNIFLCESSNEEFLNCKIIPFTDEFNYNKRCNIAAKKGKNKYIAFCNNDVTFEKKWASNIIEAMEKNNIDCASPYCSKARFMKQITPTGKIVYGYDSGMTFAGWCYVITREAYNKIGGLDEEFPFWCADNVVIEQLKEHKLKNALVTSSRVNHIGEQTLLSIPDREKITYDLVRKFNRKYGQNVLNIGI